jgi:hypothetical protein
MITAREGLCLRDRSVNRAPAGKLGLFDLQLTL